MSLSAIPVSTNGSGIRYCGLSSHKYGRTTTEAGVGSLIEESRSFRRRYRRFRGRRPRDRDLTPGGDQREIRSAQDQDAVGVGFSRRSRRPFTCGGREFAPPSVSLYFPRRDRGRILEIDDDRVGRADKTISTLDVIDRLPSKTATNLLTDATTSPAVIGSVAGTPSMVDWDSDFRHSSDGR